MKEAIIIKSYSNGLNIYLDAEVEFSILQEQMILKFEESKAFFGKAKMAISFENRKLTNEEEIDLVKIIQSHSDIKILSIVGKNEKQDEFYSKILLDIEHKNSNPQEVQFYKGSITDGQTVETDANIVIFGDIYPDCTVISNKSIVVLGGIYGKAYSGYNGESGTFIYANILEAEQICVQNLKTQPSKKSFWGIKQKNNPQIAFINNEEIFIRNYTKDIFELFH